MRGRNRVRYVEELFFERNKGIIEPYYVYTRYDDLVLESPDGIEDGKTYPSIYRLYMEMEDPSEYMFAMKYFDGYDHWTKIAKSHWMKDHIKVWRSELQLKIKGKAFQTLKEQAEKGSLDASKFIVNSDFSNGVPSNIKIPANKRGRPSSTVITEEMEQSSKKEEDRIIKESLQRLKTDLN